MSYSFRNNRICIGKLSSAATNSIAIGTSANADNNRCIAIGNEARAHGDGTWGSIAIGFRAGKINVTGYTIAIGIGALESFNTFTNCTGIGYQALNLCTGSDNVGVGYSALSALTAANSNCALGHFAAYKNASGAGNCCIGRYSMSENTSGGWNTCIGHQAGNTITSGASNVCIGRLANVTAASIASVSIGYTTSTIGSYATSIGYTASSATYGVSIGNTSYSNSSSSIAIGRAANITSSSSYNIAIGYVATTTGSSTNCVVIGNSSTASGASSIAIGLDCTCSTYCGFAIGYASQATTNDDASAIGYGSIATGLYSLCIGKESTATGHGSVAMGARAYSTALGTVAIGGDGGAYPCRAKGDGAVSIGAGSIAGTESVSIGPVAGYRTTTGNYNTLIGSSAGANITSAINCTLVGYLCGNTTLQTNGNCTGVGFDCRFGTNDGQAVCIGDTAISTGGGGAISVGSHATADWMGCGIGKLAVGGYQICSFGFANQFTTGAWFQGPAWISDSDIKIKENIVNSPLGLEFIRTLRPRKFNFLKSEKISYGFIAQECLESLKVFGFDTEIGMINLHPKSSEDPELYYDLNYGCIFTINIKATQELVQQHQACETMVSTINAIQNQIQSALQTNDAKYAEILRLLTNL